MSNNQLLIAFLLASGALPARALAQDQSAPAAGNLTASTDQGAAASGAASGTTKGYLERYRPEPHLVEIGIFGGVMFPSSRHALYDRRTSSQHEFKSVAPELGVRLAYFPLACAGLEVEGAALPSGTDDGGSAGLWAARGHAIVQLPTSSLAPFVLVGGGALGANGDSIGNDMDPAVHFGLGAKAPLDDFLSVRLDLRDTMSQKSDAENGRQTHHPELLLGLTFTLDRAKPEPPPPPDGDGDGLADADDQCPNEAGFKPDGCPARDGDGDGVDDVSDKCPAIAGPAPTGCPAATDGDGDGVLDDRDRCPQQPGQQPDGCPELDADGDGIEGQADQCPDEAETRNGYQDTDGCPDVLPAAVKRYDGVIEGIEFDFAQATIRPNSKPVLEEAAKVLVEYAGLRILIVGHTDNVGDRAANVQLSQKRADAVKAYLVVQGVDEGRITTRGAGPDEPIADNGTEAGRQKNRRMEFKVLPY